METKQLLSIKAHAPMERLEYRQMSTLLFWVFVLHYTGAAIATGSVNIDVTTYKQWEQHFRTGNGSSVTDKGLLLRQRAWTVEAFYKKPINLVAHMQIQSFTMNLEFKTLGSSVPVESFNIRFLSMKDPAHYFYMHFGIENHDQQEMIVQLSYLGVGGFFSRAINYYALKSLPTMYTAIMEYHSSTKITWLWVKNRSDIDTTIEKPVAKMYLDLSKVFLLAPVLVTVERDESMEPEKEAGILIHHWKLASSFSASVSASASASTTTQLYVAANRRIGMLIWVLIAHCFLVLLA